MAVQLTKKDRALIEGDTSLPSTKALEVKNLTTKTKRISQCKYNPYTIITIKCST